MKPHLKRDNGKAKKGGEFVLDLLEGDRLDSVLEAVQSRVAEARQKAAQIEQGAIVAAKSIQLKSNADADAIRSPSNRDATDIKTEAKLALREVHRAKTEVEELQSVLKYAQQQFKDKQKEFRLAVSGVFERYLEN